MSKPIKLPPLQTKPKPIKAAGPVTRPSIVAEGIKSGGPKPRFATVARFADSDSADDV
jgi:hypothetical protein